MHSSRLLMSLTRWCGAQCCGNAEAAAALKAWLKDWQYTPPARRGKRAVDEYEEELAWSDVSACPGYGWRVCLAAHGVGSMQGSRAIVRQGAGLRRNACCALWGDSTRHTVHMGVPVPVQGCQLAAF